MADLTIVPIVRAGLDDSGFQACASQGDMALNTGANKGRFFLEFRNTASALGPSRTVTLVTTQTVDDELDLAVPDPTVVVPGAERRKIGPFPTAVYNVKSGTDAGKVQVTYSSQVNLEVQAVSLIPAT